MLNFKLKFILIWIKLKFNIVIGYIDIFIPSFHSLQPFLFLVIDFVWTYTCTKFLFPISFQCISLLYFLFTHHGFLMQLFLKLRREVEIVLEVWSIKPLVPFLVVSFEEMIYCSWYERTKWKLFAFSVGIQCTYTCCINSHWPKTTRIIHVFEQS